MVFIVYVWFWGIQNCCKYLYGKKKNPLPNGINSDFKKPKEMTCNLNVFSCARLSPTQCLLLHNYLKGDGFAINLKSSMEEWEEYRF